MSTSRCSGWWQQTAYGRQPMQNLVLHIAQGRIEGSGTDIIAPFTFHGEFGQDGQVRMIKQYQRLHRVHYVGRYDGEGTLYGTWEILGYHGDWLIRLIRPVGADQAIEEFEPTAAPISRQPGGRGAGGRTTGTRSIQQSS